MSLERNHLSLVSTEILDGKKFDVFRYFNEKPSFSAKRAFRVISSFVSLPIMPIDQVIRWKDLKWIGESSQNTKVEIYVKNADNLDELDNSPWLGPFLNKDEDISFFQKNILKFKVVFDFLSIDLSHFQDSYVNSLSISSLVLGNEGRFYTNVFNLGFYPEYIFLTYNGKKGDNIFSSFFVSCEDSIDNSSYTKVEPNKPVKIEDFRAFNEKLKIMLVGLGTNEEHFSVDGFSFVVSGKKQVNLYES